MQKNQPIQQGECNPTEDYVYKVTVDNGFSNPQAPRSKGINSVFHGIDFVVGWWIRTLFTSYLTIE